MINDRPVYYMSHIMSEKQIPDPRDNSLIRISPPPWSNRFNDEGGVYDREAKFPETKGDFSFADAFLPDTEQEDKQNRIQEASKGLSG
jgi:hypothetical protein